MQGAIDDGCESACTSASHRIVALICSAQTLKVALLDQSLDVAVAHVELTVLGQGDRPVSGQRSVLT